MTASNDLPGWNRSPDHEPDADGWQSTRAQTALATQIMRDDDDDPSQPRPDVGRQTAPGLHELFVSCAPAEAMQQQFEHLSPEFIAVHDLATASSRKLLTGIAGASGRTLQKLVIRRQGQGTPLATLEFVQLPTTDGGSLRMYTTDIGHDADPALRHGLAMSLLAHSRLGVVMVGDTSSAASAFKPLREAMISGIWRNRHLLLLPLASASALVNQGLELAGGTSVNVRTTPQVTRPADAWSFITGSWHRLREHLPTAGPTAVPELGGLTSAARAATAVAGSERQSAETQPMPMLPMPEIPRTSGKPAAPASLLQRYAQQVSELAGVVGCCVFEASTGRNLHHAGAGPRPLDLASRGSDLLAAMSTASRGLGFGHALPEAAITLGAHHLLLRPVPGHPGLALHAVLDKTHANLTLARLQVQRLDEMLTPPSPP